VDRARVKCCRSASAIRTPRCEPEDFTAAVLARTGATSPRYRAGTGRGGGGRVDFLRVLLRAAGTWGRRSRTWKGVEEDQRHRVLGA
jgi:hypothetical protein